MTRTVRRLLPARWLAVLPWIVFCVLVCVRLSDLFNTPAAGAQLCGFELLAVAYHVRAARRRGLSRAQRRPYWLISAALAVLIAGGVGFSIAFNTGQKTTWGAPLILAVVARTAIVPILLAALLSFGAEPMDRRARWKLVMDVTTVLGAGLMLMWYLVLGPALAGGHLFDPLRLGSVLFSVGDVILLVGVGTVMLRGAVAEARRPLNLLLAGTLGYLAVDTGFLYMSIRDVGPDAIIPTLLLAPMFLILLASLQPSTATGEATGTAGRLRGQSRLPYVALASGYGLLVIAAARAGLYPWLGLVAGALLMTLGVAARQLLASRENYRLVVTDSLTGLANRLQLRTDLAAAVERHRRTTRPLAVLLIDLDGFKAVNDTYGHEVGDQLLVSFAEVLRRTVRDTDAPARLGGDEFAVVLPSVAGAQDAIHVAERILAACADPLILSGHPVRLRASIGVAVLEHPEDCDPAELLHRADLAMYAAKRHPSQHWVLYSPEVADPRSDTFAAELAVAADEGQLRVLYQPIVDLVSGDLVAVEALVRWQHPTRGLLGPDAFIPLAERGGEIHRIGAWVLREACRQAGVWQAGLPADRSLHLSVNFSPLQLERPDLAEEVFAILNATGFDPHGLVVEITESALVDDLSAVPHLEALRARGVRVALDDFGTGYSSLRYLTQLPVDILKLDRCFVAELNGDPARAAVAEAVIRLSQILRMDTVAEGIEDAAQATELTLLGYRTAQGYHFARPQAAEEIELLLHQATPVA